MSSALVYAPVVALLVCSKLSWYANKREQEAIDDALVEAEKRPAASRAFPRL